MTLEETIRKIRPVDVAAMAAAQQPWDGLPDCGNPAHRRCAY